jgi:hypothetical protein
VTSTQQQDQAALDRREGHLRAAGREPVGHWRHVASQTWIKEGIKWIEEEIEFEGEAVETWSRRTRVAKLFEARDEDADEMRECEAERGEGRVSEFYIVNIKSSSSQRLTIL